METRSYRFGELRRKIQESASEFKPVFGDGVESSEKKINSQAYRDIEEETKNYDGGINNPGGKNRGESVLAQTNMGMSDIEYDVELDDKFKENARAGLEGYTSALDKKNHSKEELGNATRSDAIAKAAMKKAVQTKKEKDSYSEVGITNAQKPKDATHLHVDTIGESKKTSLLKFKNVQLISDGHMLSHVPDEYKQEGRKFYMQDCKGNKYMVEWGEKPCVEKLLNEQKTFAEMDRIKYLFGYNSKGSNTTNSMRMNEGKNVEDMLGHVRKLMK